MENNQEEKLIELEIISPEGIILKEKVDEVIIPTTTGQIAILPGHTPVFTKLAGGELAVRKKGEETLIAITGGFLEISQNKVIVLADYAIRSEQIEARKAEEARKRAEEMLKAGKDKKDFALAEKELKKSILELKIADKIRKRHHL